jgi:hypothetical protein
MSNKITRDLLLQMYEEAKAKVVKKKDSNRAKDKDGDESIPTGDFKVIAQSPDGPKIVVSPGLKIVHKQSGLLYTVKDVEVKNGSPVVFAEAGDGAEIVIRANNFKNYERI